MRLNQLKYFIKVVECGSITKAAQELYLSQPSLTQAVSSLEAEYNLKLFDRTAKGLSLTPRGRDFLEYARSVLDSSKALDQTFGRKDHPFIQRVAIASQQFDFIYDILLDLYRENKEQFLQIDLKENDRGEIIHMVESRKADIGLLVMAEKDSKPFKSEVLGKNLEIHALDRSPVYASMGKKSKLYNQTSIDVEEAEQYLHVVLDTELSLRRELRYKNELNEGINHEHLIFCNTIGVCKKFLEETEAILLSPKWILGFFEDTQIRSVPLTMNGKTYPKISQLLWIKRAQEEFDPIEKQFMELLIQRFEHKDEDYHRQASVPSA